MRINKLEITRLSPYDPLVHTENSAGHFVLSLQRTGSGSASDKSRGPPGAAAELEGPPGKRMKKVGCGEEARPCDRRRVAPPCSPCEPGGDLAAPRLAPAAASACSAVSRELTESHRPAGQGQEMAFWGTRSCSGPPVTPDSALASQELPPTCPHTFGAHAPPQALLCGTGLTSIQAHARCSSAACTCGSQGSSRFPAGSRAPISSQTLHLRNLFPSQVSP